MSAPTPEWDTRVSEILHEYIAVTDPVLKTWTANLSFQGKCQAITRIARVNGHGWLPITGEDIAAMSRTGRPPTDFFRPLWRAKFNKNHEFWTASIHLVSDSTVSFLTPNGNVLVCASV